MTMAALRRAALSLLVLASCSGGNRDGGFATGSSPFTGAWSFENPLPSGANLHRVWGTASNDVWAVGEGGLVLHYDGIRWSVARYEAAADLSCLGGSGPGDVHAAGTVAAHWNGTAWSTSAAAPGGFRPWAISGLWASGPRDAWATMGEEGIFHWDGSGWTASVIGAGFDHLSALWGSAPDDVWAAGAGVSQFDGETWTLVGATAHFDGSAWTTVTTPRLPAEDMSGTASDDIWAVGAPRGS